ncbi:MAG: PilX N-terminal [Thermoanaerobaculia bacterium]|nr:PilX N-terminal [Thermoanaerobaculia bacterium]
MTNSVTRRFLRQPKQRGAALILTVVVIMVLTTLGLAMVGFSTTEERTATTYRDGLQARATAEAGIRLAQEFFRNPVNRRLVPLYSSYTSDCSGGLADYCGTTESTIETSLNAKGVWRAPRTALSPGRYAGAANTFFVGPFNGDWGQTFGGTYSSTAASDLYDLKFNCTNPSSQVKMTSGCWLDDNLNVLLQTSSDYNLATGSITDISFYGPPTVNGKAYGICTVRVTAVKTDARGSVLAREVMEAVIGDAQPKPAVLGNGNILFKTTAGVMCGDGCENVQANGDATVGTITGGEDPMISATGSVSGGGSNTKAGAAAVRAPQINPWDLAYKPTTTAELSKYYLLAARRLDVVWRDGIAANNPASRPCGLNNLARCQDYNLEYDTAGNPKTKRLATDMPYMYKWDTTGAGWTECGSGTSPLSGGVTCPGAPTFSVTRADDLDVTGSDDTATLPFNVNRVPQTSFNIASDQSGATVLVDGKFDKSGSMNTIMTVIAAGSMSFSSSTTWGPAMSNGVMWITGRDLDTHANCCAPSNTCATNVNSYQTYAAIIATHEQFKSGAQNALLGILIAENRVNHDPYVTGTLAIDSDNGDHGSLCDRPDWPWALPTIPMLLSLKSVPD